MSRTRFWFALYKVFVSALVILELLAVTAWCDAVRVGPLGLSKLVSRPRNGKEQRQLAVRTGDDVVAMVSSVWDTVIAVHQDGLLDPKVNPRTVSNRLSSQEALYHYQAARDGIVDSARLLVTFGIAAALSEINVPEHPLLEAIAKNDVTGLKSILDRGEIDINTYDWDESFRTTALHFAVSLENRTEIIEVLVESGADVEARAAHGATPLMVAASLNNVEAIRTLVQNGGASITATHYFAKSTAMHFAAEMGHVQAIEELCLLLKGDNHDVNTLLTTTGGTALHTAADSNRPSVVRALVERCGARVNVLLNGDTTPLYLAAQRGYSKVVSELIALGADINYVMPRDSVFAQQKRRANRHLVPIDASSGAHTARYDYLNKNSEIGNGATALHAACENGHLDAARVLLNAGAKQLDSMEGSTPLVISLQYQHPRIALALLTEGTSDPGVNTRTKRDGAFPLFVAAGHGYEDVVKALLARKEIDVNLRNFANASALSHAIYRGRLGTAHLLAKRPSIRVGKSEIQALMSSETALRSDEFTKDIVEKFTIAADKAEVTSTINSLLTFERFSPNQMELFRSLIHRVAYRGKLDLLRIEDGIDVTPVHVAAQTGNLEAVRIMLDEFPNVGFQAVNARADNKLSMATPLYLSASQNHVETVRFLLEKGHADASIGVLHDGMEIPPLFVAAEKGFADTVQVLLKHVESGSERRRSRLSRDSHDILPIEIAAMGGHGTVVELLLPKRDPEQSTDALSALTLAIGYSKSVLPVIRAVGKAILRNSSMDADRAQQLTRLILGQRATQTGTQDAKWLPREHREVFESVRLLGIRWSTDANKLPFSPLHAAIIAYSDEETEQAALQALELVDILLTDASLDLDKAFLHRTKSSKMTPLALATEAGRVRIIQRLIAVLDSNKPLLSKILTMTNAQGETPLDTARRLRDHNLIRLLDAAISKHSEL